MFGVQIGLKNECYLHLRGKFVQESSLCSLSLPKVIGQASADPNVMVRYYTSRIFACEAYIVHDIALPAMFNLFWDYAETL